MTAAELKTSVRVTDDLVDEFRALALLLRMRPHQLAAHLVTEGLTRYRRDSDLGPRIAELAEISARARARHQAAQADNVIPIRRNHP